MKRTTEEKLNHKRSVLISRTAQILNISENDAENLLKLGRTQSFRINTLKADESILPELQNLGWQGKRIEWAKDGYSIEEGLQQLRDSSFVENGLIYIQNAASWLPAYYLEAAPGDSVLDVAAAPGGKSAHIAALTNGSIDLTVNDNSRSRLAKMRRNFERLGVQPLNYLLYDATKLSRRLDSQTFDKILLDAPCSGEGLINIATPKSLETWSVAAIKRLQKLQRKLLVEAWQMLKPGGTLVYSTCTMAPEENEQVIDWFLRKRADASVARINFNHDARVPVITSWNGVSIRPEVSGAVRLKPSEELEAFFVCKLIKSTKDEDFLI